MLLRLLLLAEAEFPENRLRTRLHAEVREEGPHGLGGQPQALVAALESIPARQDLGDEILAEVGSELVLAGRASRLQLVLQALLETSETHLQLLDQALGAALRELDTRAAGCAAGCLPREGCDKGSDGGGGGIGGGGRRRWCLRRCCGNIRLYRRLHQRAPRAGVRQGGPHAHAASGAECQRGAGGGGPVGKGREALEGGGLLGSHRGHRPEEQVPAVLQLQAGLLQHGGLCTELFQVAPQGSRLHAKHLVGLHKQPCDLGVGRVAHALHSQSLRAPPAALQAVHRQDPALHGEHQLVAAQQVEAVVSLVVARGLLELANLTLEGHRAESDELLPEQGDEVAAIEPVQRRLGGRQRRAAGRGRAHAPVEGLVDGEAKHRNVDVGAERVDGCDHLLDAIV
mmetsp:Transcript_156539/g.502393  ORF Transcript_156539/g.502393 Transcript_156539/m.502393 type:complete len:399 (+) Transcript_156539:1187-2383(+)